MSEPITIAAILPSERVSVVGAAVVVVVVVVGVVVVDVDIVVVDVSR